ncbi:hypothetical protein OKC48_21915 [Methylorubrum extorquens]|uniref:hypothetical protein n=1 Tax=Methylorubrum extorquens TaxID=408 RepID=UPI002238D820|nr:hypothetical protein [Methylorubrum extorquens]UYW25900.1 hypothetical protein OKC48_21915 [Methylorubrum extorquens]
MPISKEQREHLRGNNVFPDTKTIAEFHFISQTITLDTIDRSQFEGLNDIASFSESRSAVAVIFHELTHWADLVGSVWGRRLLREVYATLPILGQLNNQGGELEFWRMVSLHDRSRRLMFPAYYRTREGGQDLGNPTEGSIEIAGGIEFDSLGRPDSQRPILFVRFFGRDASTYVRQPLTVGSLIETLAVCSEFAATKDIVPPNDAVSKRIEADRSEADLKQLLNCTDLTLYTCCARMLSHFSGINDYGHIYNLAAKLAFICLNLQKVHFYALSPPALMAVWGKRNYASKTNLDPAFAFAAICIAAGRYSSSTGDDGWINHGLTRCCLPPSRKIFNQALNGMERERPLEHSAFSETGQYLLDAGYKIAAARIAEPDPALTIGRAVQHRLPLPPLFGGLELGRLSFSTFDHSKFDAEFMFDAEWQLDKATRNFLSSCR